MSLGHFYTPFIQNNNKHLTEEQLTDLLRRTCARVAGTVTVVSAVILLVALGLCGVEGRV